jgi:hypothetical protein
MTQEAFCPEHGPYDASLGACPYPHAGVAPRPGVPQPLEDDLPTDFGMGGGTGPTMPPGNGGEEGETELPANRRNRREVMDYDEEEETDLPRHEPEEDMTELESPIAPVLGLLWVKEGARRGKYYPIKHGTVIGRKDGSLILDDPKVSGRHAKFTIENDEFVIWDLGTSNGTMVNGKKIRQATVLSENDLVKIGDSVFVIKLLESKPKRKAGKSPSVSGTKKASKIS